MELGVGLRGRGLGGTERRGKLRGEVTEGRGLNGKEGDGGRETEETGRATGSWTWREGLMEGEGKWEGRGFEGRGTGRGTGRVGG